MEEIILDTENFRLTQAEFIVRLLVAVGTGGLIGLEREHSAMNEHIKSFAGIRTFIFLSLLGFIGGLTYFLLSEWVFLSVIISVTILTGISYWVTASKGEIGATTEFSALVTFILGSLTFLGFIELSVMITVVVVVILSSKLKLQNIVGKITAEELYDVVRFVVIALLIFPLLPNETFGPYDVLNPREIGWVIILTSGLGFAGYILMKFMETQKGILISGIVGGLVSSTAVTWVFSKKSKDNASHSHSCAIAILAATSISIARVLIWVFIFNKSLFNQLYWVFILIFAAAIGVTLFLYFKRKDKKAIENSDVKKGKPLDLKGTFVFGIIFVAITLIVSYSNDVFGASGIFLSSAIAGLSDIDAITISVSKLAGGSIDLNLASKSVLIATISNTLVKMAIGIWAGSPALRKLLYIGYGAVFVAALIAFLLL